MEIGKMHYKKEFRYLNADINLEFTEKLSKARDWLLNWESKHNNLAICGTTGCGKTWLIMAFLNELAKTAQHVKSGETWEEFWVIPGVEYVNSKDFFDKIKKQFAINNQKLKDHAESDVWSWTNARLLIIDEFGLGYGTESELIELTSILDTRWRKGLPTVFLSNLNMKGLNDYLQDRGRQRAFDNADYVEIEDTSKRIKPKEL
jgi:DNA replication protein DnaC